jgi:hypothetical protein
MFATIALASVMSDRTSNQLRKLIRSNSDPRTTLHVSEEIDCNLSFLTLSVHFTPTESDVMFYLTVTKLLVYLRKRGCVPFIYDHGIGNAPDELIGDGDVTPVYRTISTRYMTKCHHSPVAASSYPPNVQV